MTLISEVGILFPLKWRMTMSCAAGSATYQVPGKSTAFAWNFPVTFNVGGEVKERTIVVHGVPLAVTDLQSAIHCYVSLRDGTLLAVFQLIQGCISHDYSLTLSGALKKCRQFAMQFEHFDRKSEVVPMDDLARLAFRVAVTYATANHSILSYKLDRGHPFEGAGISFMDLGFSVANGDQKIRKGPDNGLSKQEYFVRQSAIPAERRPTFYLEGMYPSSLFLPGLASRRLAFDEATLTLPASLIPEFSTIVGLSQKGSEISVILRHVFRGSVEVDRIVVEKYTIEVEDIDGVAASISYELHPTFIRLGIMGQRKEKPLKEAFQRILQEMKTIATRCNLPIVVFYTSSLVFFFHHQFVDVLNPEYPFISLEMQRLILQNKGLPENSARSAFVQKGVEWMAAQLGRSPESITMEDIANHWDAGIGPVDTTCIGLKSELAAQEESAADELRKPAFVPSGSAHISKRTLAWIPPIE